MKLKLSLIITYCFFNVYKADFGKTKTAAVYWGKVNAELCNQFQDFEAVLFKVSMLSDVQIFKTKLLVL